MADRLTGIEVFALAVRLGSLSAAARSMGMSAAMAAKHLGALEARLGATLVNRTTRRLSLTEAGVSYLDRAERILVDLREAESDVSARSITIEGTLRVSAPASFGVMHLAPLIAEFCARQPGVTIELGLNDRYVDLLEERWDVAIRIGRLADSSLIARKLASARLSVCAAPGYLARRGTPGSIDELGQHNCLGYTLAPLVGATHWGFERDGSVKIPIRGTLNANNGEALVSAAQAGQGIVYAPRFMTAGFIAAGDLVELEIGMPLLDLGAIYAVTHATRRPAAKTRAWIDFLAERMPDLAKDW
ncbi:LysR family transcriptional regulator [Sphingomonas sp. BIUV-7]|uniref:LysR family transcriptional regulator n=1 Tax=Sphingomonas natans TaxID=3063330 RepID=A0ABT8YCC4_9SPHN|nr:LysR family transcriptional regulator [Sphingomonas sp. BIUV-7]MDO6415290.1 LysR family transcriptional regulator [Sphingomonas sp. BIUV-7]